MQWRAARKYWHTGASCATLVAIACIDAAALIAATLISAPLITDATLTAAELFADVAGMPNAASDGAPR